MRRHQDQLLASDRRTEGLCIRACQRVAIIVRHEPCWVAAGVRKRAAQKCPGRRTGPARETGAAFAKIFDTLPNLRLAVPESELRYRKNVAVRALESLPLTFDPS